MGARIKCITYRPIKKITSHRFQIDYPMKNLRISHPCSFAILAISQPLYWLSSTINCICDNGYNNCFLCLVIWIKNPSINNELMSFDNHHLFLMILLGMGTQWNQMNHNIRKVIQQTNIPIRSLHQYYELYLHHMNVIILNFVVTDHYVMVMFYENNKHVY